jgi:aspartyl-tRNA(Asn)/glutamyl-tRNA(Gln) amidotransferase subunit A
MIAIDARGATAVAIADGVRAGKLRARDVAEQYLDRIARLDGALGCYLLIDAEGARRRADAVDAAYKAGRDPGALAGVPLGVKDIFCTRGVETTCASKILRGFVPPYESTVTARLAGAGAVMLGKLNMDEFAMGSSNENSAFKPVKNPWSHAHVPGGSSGGSAAAIAASLCAGAIGTDTGGSIRQPAALCGVVGMKPTYGRVSRYGVIAFASSLDHPGPFGRTVEDAAALLEAMAGADPHDSTSIPAPVGAYRAAARAGQRRPRAAQGHAPRRARRVLPARHGRRGRSGRARRAGRARTRGRADRQGVVAQHQVRDRDLLSDLHGGGFVEPGPLRRCPLRVPHAGRALAGGDVHEDARGRVRPEPKRRIMLGTYVLRAGYYEAYYGKALRARRKIADDFQAAFAGCDAIVTPTSPIPAFKFGEKTSDPLQMYLADVLTVGPDLAGIPALSQSCGFTKAGLPIGLQTIAPALGEEICFRVAGAYEARTKWHERLPPETAS